MYLCLALALLTSIPVRRVQAFGCGGQEGVFVCHPGDPAKFNLCMGEREHVMSCPAGLHFNTRSQVCDWPQNADCGKTDLLPPPSPLYDDPDSPPDPDYYDVPDEEGDGELATEQGPVMYDDFNHGQRYSEPAPSYDDFHRQSYSHQYADFNIRTGDRLVAGHRQDDGFNRNRNDVSVGRHRSSLTSDSRRTAANRNSYRYSDSRSRRRQFVTRQRQQNGMMTNRGFDDGYDRFNSNAARKSRKLKSQRQRVWRNENSNGRKGTLHDDNFIERNDVNGYDWNHQNNIYHSEQNTPRDSHNGGKRHDNAHFSSPDWNRNVNRRKTNLMDRTANKMTENPITNSNDNINNNNNIYKTRQQVDSRADIPAQGGLQLGHYPWWTSKSASPRELRKRFPLPTHGVPKVKSRRQRPTQPSVRRPQGQNAKVQRIFRPKGAPVSPSVTSADLLPQKHQQRLQQQQQQPISAARSITAAAASGPKRTKKVRKIGPCSPKTCQLPDCRCVGTDIPGGLPVQETPQMIMLTFDDSVNVANFDYYTHLFGGKILNPNGCPIKGTFYVSGDATQYHFVEKLRKKGQEIASHSLSHRSPTTYWATAGYDGYVNEIEGMRKKLSDKSKIPHEDIKGMRVPFLQVGGDDQYQMLEDFGYTYDTSMVTGNLYRNDDPPIWPFTLDYAPDSTTCSLTPCPTKSYPGLWEVPLIRWYGSNGLACAMPDGCTIDAGQKGTLQFLEDNFYRHYNSNKSPLGIFLHASWFRRKDGNLEGLTQFLQKMVQREDVWVVTVSQVVDWIRNPVPNDMVGSLPSWTC